MGIVVIIVIAIIGITVWVILKKAKEKKEKRAEELRQQELKDAQEREKAEILRKQQEEEQWQEDIKTGKVDFKKAEAFYDAGTMLLEAGKIDEAIVQFTKAIEFNPRYTNAYCKRGIAYKRKGDCDQAIEDYQQALRFDDNDSEVHYNLGLAYMERKNFYAAKEAFNMAYHYGVDAILNKGIAEFNIGEEERVKYNSTTELHAAYRTFEEVLRKDPNNSEARRLLGMAQERIPYRVDSRL